MMIMVSNQTGIEVGLMAAKNPGRIGHLYSPGAYCKNGPWPEVPYALDNGAWTDHLHKRDWDEQGWRQLLRWALLCGQRPLWAVVPDVVGERIGTLERWHAFSPIVAEHGFRPAFAAQDGMSFDDVPSDDCIVFLGGSTEWKEAAIEPWCARFAGRVHVARVNYWDRLVRSWRAGAISVDGTGWYHRKQRAQLLQFLRETSSGGNMSAAEAFA